MGNRALAVAALAATAALSAPSLADAAPKHKHKHQHRVTFVHGYRCVHYNHRHKVRHKGVVWPKRGTFSKVVCVKPGTAHKRHLPKRHVGGFAYGRYAVPAYVVRCESGFNPHAVNYSNPARPAGLYQMLTSTWLGYGGGRFASTADRATEYEQGVIASRVLRGQGPRAWACW